jgi:peptidoglycan/xylan/chitin deacetylase (PgdA/CDA1 family)
MRGLVLGATLGAAAGVAWAVRGRSAAVLAPSVWRGSGTRPSLALTFDDGPSESTPELLRVLERHRARATFFVCGLNVRRLPAILQETAAGHEIGNHTWSHPLLCFHSPKTIAGELERTQQAIAGVSGTLPALFRAPYGVRGFGLREAQRRLNLLGVMWTVIGRDWTLGMDAIVKRVATAARPGGIICLHDGRKTNPRPDVRATVEAVDRLIPLLRERGFRFETVSQILCPTTN